MFCGVFGKLSACVRLRNESINGRAFARRGVSAGQDELVNTSGLVRVLCKSCVAFFRPNRFNAVFLAPRFIV